MAIPVATVFQRSQIGIETVYGTLPAGGANKLLGSMGFDLRPQGESNVFGPPGSKYDTTVAPNKLWSTGAINGFPSYTELQYLFSSIFQGTVVTAAGVSTWTFISNQAAPDTTKSFSVQQGSTVSGEVVQATGMQARSLSLVFDRNAGISMGGEVYGRALTHGGTLTATPTSLPLVPILAKDANVYLDRTDATALGTTQVTQAFRTEFAVNNKFGPKYVLNRANGLSPDSLVELKPAVASRFMHERTAAGLAFLDDFENGSTAWMRIEAMSGVLIPTSATPYSLTVDMAVSVERPEGFRDEQGSAVVEFTLRGLFDGVWGNAFRAVLVNGQAAL